MQMIRFKVIGRVFSLRFSEVSSSGGHKASKWDTFSTGLYFQTTKTVQYLVSLDLTRSRASAMGANLCRWYLSSFLWE